MQRCRIRFTVTGEIAIDLQEDMVESLEEIIELIEDGTPPIWVETLIREGIQMEELEIEDWKISSANADPEEELDFDE